MCQKSKVTIKCAVCACIGILSHLGGTAISQRWNYALTWVKCPFHPGGISIENIEINPPIKKLARFSDAGLQPFCNICNNSRSRAAGVGIVT